MRIRAGPGFSRESQAFQLFVDCKLLQGSDIVLGIKCTGDAAFRPSPIIENARDVSDFAGLFREPEEELKVLYAVELLVEAAGVLRQLAAHAEQMAGKHHTAEGEAE